MSRVKKIFTRSMPHVVAEPGDYDAAKIFNDSGVIGENAATAFADLEDQLSRKIHLAGDLGGTLTAPRVQGAYGRPIQDIAPGDGDYLFYSKLRQRWEPRARLRTQVTPYVWKQLWALSDIASAGSASAVGLNTIGGVPLYVKGSILSDSFHDLSISWQPGLISISIVYKEGIQGIGGPKCFGPHIWMPYKGLPGYVQGCPVLLTGRLRQTAGLDTGVAMNVPSVLWTGVYSDDEKHLPTNYVLLHGLSFTAHHAAGDGRAEQGATLYGDIGFSSPNLVARLPEGTQATGASVGISVVPGMVTSHLDNGGAPQDLPYLNKKAQTQFSGGSEGDGAITQNIGLCFGCFSSSSTPTLSVPPQGHPSPAGISISDLRVYQLLPV